MKQTELKGIITPILTPMNADESINTDELRTQIDRLIDGGVHGIFPFGTNGEGYILNEKEKCEVLEAAIDQVKGRVPVYAGSGCISTQDTIRMSKEAEKLGADVLSIITPSFAVASQKELYDHYVEVAKHVDTPIVLYNIPARTGNKLLPETVKKLAKDVDLIIGAKDSSGDWDNLKAYITETRELDKKFYVLSGNDSLILPALKEGGVGGIAGCSNVYHMCFHPSTTFSKRASLRRQRQHRILLQASELYSNTAILTQLLKKRLLCSDILLAIADVHSTICAMRVWKRLQRY